MTQTSKATVCILYGFCEGRAVARRLQRSLRAAGFTVTNNAREADIILAHSGGCFNVPEPRPGQKIFLVGVPYWPGKWTLYSFVEHILVDLHVSRHGKELKYWHYKIIWNFIYFWNLVANIRMIYNRSTGRLWNLPGAVVIRNEKDSYCVPRELPFKHKYRNVALPRHHDDLWYRPALYIDVIQSEYGH